MFSEMQSRKTLDCFCVPHNFFYGRCEGSTEINVSIIGNVNLDIFR